MQPELLVAAGTGSIDQRSMIPNGSLRPVEVDAPTRGVAANGSRLVRDPLDRPRPTQRCLLA